MTANSQQKMAALTVESDIKIELSTRPALRLWQGREKTDSKHGILGLPGFCKMVRNIEQSIKEDDPYADFYFHKIETAIEDLTFDLANEYNDITSYIDENIPAAMQLPNNASKNPVVIPIRFASRIGFQLVYQLLKVDQIVLKVLLANHIGLLPNKDKFQTIARVEKKVRAVIHMVFNYRHTGVTRDDIASNNQKAQKAISLMGDLDEGYLVGEIRSENAPKLPTKRVNTLVNSDKSDVPNDFEEQLEAVIKNADNSRSKDGTIAENA